MSQAHQTTPNVQTEPGDNPTPERTTLYRFYDAHDVLLYVGITNNPTSRWAEHSRSKFEWQQAVRATLEHFPSREEAHKAEIAAIQAEKPRWNIQHRGSLYRPEVPLELWLAAEQRLRDGHWLTETEVSILFRVTATEVDRWLVKRVPLLRRPLRFRPGVGDEREVNPEDVAELYRETTKIRSCYYPDGVPGQFDTIWTHPRGLMLLPDGTPDVKKLYAFNAERT